MSPSLASVAAAVAVLLAAASEGRPRTIVDYNVGSHLRRETGLPGVAVEGEYRWRTPNGEENVVRYTADKNGYVARGNVVPGRYDPLGNPRLVHSYYQTPFDASAEAPAEGPSEVAKADNDGILMPTREDAEDSAAGEGTDDAIHEKINEIPVEKAAEGVPAEEEAEDTSGGDVAKDVSDTEIADDTPAEEVAADEEAAEDVPADGAPEVDSTRAEKAVPAEEMAGMNAIIFPDDPSPSVPLVEAVERKPEAEADGMNAIIFPENVPAVEMTEPEVSTESAPAVEVENRPDGSIPATEVPEAEESGAPEIVMPVDPAMDENNAEEGLLATEPKRRRRSTPTEAPEEVNPATEAPEEVNPATEAPEEVNPATEAPEEVDPATEAPEANAEETSTEAPTANGDDAVTARTTGEEAADVPAEEDQATEAPSDVAAPEEVSVTEVSIEEDVKEELPATELPVTEEASSAIETALTGEDFGEEIAVTESPMGEGESTEVPESLAAESEAGGSAVTSAPELLIMEDPAINEAPVMAADALLMAVGNANGDDPTEDTALSMFDSAVAKANEVETADAPPKADDEVADTDLAMPDEVRMPLDAMENDAPAMPPMRSADEEEQEEPEILGYIHSHPHAHFFGDDHHAYPAHPHPQPYRPHFKIYKGKPDGDHKVHHGHVFNFYH
nr:fibrous sheath CABYR-binding protein-like [Penaeus vannamei]